MIECLLGLFAGCLLLPISVLFFQALFASMPVRSAPKNSIGCPQFAVLIPAHNESKVLAATLQTMIPQLRQGDRLVVVADNCSDDTASIAELSGAEVVERHNEQLRGKGYALDCGVHYLESSPPEVLIVIDADCKVGEGCLQMLAAQVFATGRPVQSLDLMKAPAGAGLKTRIAEFAWLVKNLVRPLGFLRLGLPCQLMGTGMAFPWEDIRTAELASGHIVEDLKMGLDFCRKGKAPLFFPEATVTSCFPSNEEGVRTQRTRWEHGHIGVILKDGPALAVEALRTGNVRLLAMALDLAVPPLALLTLATAAIALLSAWVWVAGGAAWPAALGGGAFFLLGTAVMLAWGVHGRKVISLSTLAYAPIYALMKIPLYLQFVVRRQVDWVRSKRDE